MTDQERTARASTGRRWWFVVVALLIATTVVFSACGDDEEEGGDGAAQTEEAGQQPTGEPIKVYTFSDVNTQGPQYKNIAEAARVYGEWVNDNGGVKGRPLEVTHCDMKGTPTDATACARKAVSDKAVAVIGSFSFTGDAVVPTLEAGDTAYFGLCCPLSPKEFTSEAVLSMGNHPLYGVGLVKRAVEDGCQKPGAVIIEGAEAFKPFMDNAAKALGTKIVKYVSLPAVARDYSPQVAEATSGTDCLIMIVSETPFIGWMPPFAQSGAEHKMYGPWGNLNEKVAEGHEEVVEGDVIALYGYTDISTDAWKDYRDALEQYDADPDQDYNSPGGAGTWAAYEAFTQIVEGMDGEINNKTFLEAAQNATINLEGKMPPLDFSQEWEGGLPGFERIFNRTVSFDTFKDGKVVPLSTELEDISDLALGKSAE